MSSKDQKHDYHLVDPSPWPIYTSFATLITAVGSVYYFHSKVMWAMLLGFALLIYGAYMWFRDVVNEAEHQGHHTPVVQIHHRLMDWAAYPQASVVVDRHQVVHLSTNRRHQFLKTVRQVHVSFHRE